MTGVRPSDERCAICTKTRDEHVSITTHKFKDDPRPSKERNILGLAKNLQDELHVYCKGAAGSGDNFYARTFANLADRADELVKLLESAPETGERRFTGPGYVLDNIRTLATADSLIDKPTATERIKLIADLCATILSPSEKANSCGCVEAHEPNCPEAP